MKKRFFKVLSTVLLIALAMSLTACGKGNIYDSLAEEGYSVKVRYDAGGAVVNETQNVTIVEVFNDDNVVTTADGKTGVLLLAPDDDLRGADGKFKLAKTDGENNFFQVGWYTRRTPRVDSEGRPLDAYGVLTEVSKKEQGYVYEDKWDFARDVVTPDMLDENGELVLYAAWAPFFTYEFYSQNEAGVFEKIDSVRKLTLLVPTYDEKYNEYEMNDFPELDGKVFGGAYLDEAMTVAVTEDINGRQTYVDYEKGISTSAVVKIYLKWTEKQS